MDLTPIIQRGLVLAAKSHHWHLTTRSYARHVALGQLYEYFHAAIDQLAEAAIGAGIELATTAKATWKVNFPPDSAAEAEVEGFIKELKALKGDPWLMNIVEEIESNLYAILYKLKQLS